MTLNKVDREAVPEMPNRLGIAGIEFIEYATSRPQALGQVLENMGFRPVARHRSREVTLYRQGTMNLVVNANPDDARVSGTVDGQPVISAVAFRVQDALKAHNRCMELGAWSVGSHAQAMELHIPAVHGPGGSRFYFVDRWQEFSIYDIDFKPIPTVDQQPPALSGMGYFGVVQYIGAARSADWQTYYEHMFDFSPIPDEERFGILPKGKLMKSPCGSFLNRSSRRRRAPGVRVVRPSPRARRSTPSWAGPPAPILAPKWETPAAGAAPAAPRQSLRPR